MRISRKNFSLSNSNDAGQPASPDDSSRKAQGEHPLGQPATTDGERVPEARRLPHVAGNPQQQAGDGNQGVETPSDESCQSYFYLAPNVRFTRTPDRGSKQRSSPVENASEVSASETVSPIEAEPAAQQPLVGPTPTPVMPATMPAAQVIGQPADGGSVNVQAPANDAHSSTAHLGFLSDHAFFEFMSDDAITAQPAAEVPAQRGVEPVRAVRTAYEEVPVAGQVARPQEGIVSLYKVVECNGSASPTPAPSSSRPIAARPANPSSQPTGQRPATQQNPEGNQDAAGRSRVSISMPSPTPRSLSSSTQALPPIGAGSGQQSLFGSYEFPSGDLLQLPQDGPGFQMTQEQLERNAGLLESVLEDFKVRGEIIHVRPGPVVTLYEFEPAPGIKSSRIVNLADDIARSMSAISARVAVVPGRNVIGIELPNTERETVYFREMIDSNSFRATNCKLALSLGKTIGGEPVVADLAKMPHLLVAGTTGSGKSVAINTMILSLLYRLKPEECRLIMVDPKMLELSIYDDIPHLLTPVVTDPKKAVTALKWAVREMEDRYRKMARLGVRNINGFNQRAAAASQKGEPVIVSVQTGFDRDTGEPVYEQQEMDLAPMPYIVIIVDEMADLMMVAGKEIEGAIQRLAQMARAAGIHLIMATQRPSVDVITGTIKANFPTRISFQVTSKIDSRTILGEQGAEQLLGMGDMLHMSGGGRINRVHGAFVSDEEVEQVVAHLKSQGRPAYLETVTAEEEEELEEEEAVFDKGAIASEDGDDLYDKAVKIVLRDKRCSTSYIQRRLGIGYNRAATLVEKMENEGLVGAPNHVGKREILAGKREQPSEE
ncbi:DNA translocase FtsK (plasmid) [Roseibium aggregatum]|uniref:DNA translocase FtsK n=1 Tax=Roseibium aggregatum TaxID=187304 RepID=UPI001E32D77B|nr:DNA translocase FtsK [Roseibium aggregatum]UES59537.1 DNA translocase FtsK [Roseibium aggregatum]